MSALAKLALSDRMIERLELQASAELKGWNLIGPDKRANITRNALRRRELMSGPKLTALGWQVVEILWSRKSDPRAETAGYLATGKFKLRYRDAQ